MSAFIWGTFCWAGMKLWASRDRYLSAGHFDPPRILNWPKSPHRLGLKHHSSTIISLHQNQDKSIKHVVKMENGMGSPLAAKKLNVGKYPGWPMEKSMFWMDVPIGGPELSTSAKMTTASWVGNPKGPVWNRVGQGQLLNVSIPSVLNWKLWKMQM